MIPLDAFALIPDPTGVRSYVQVGFAEISPSRRMELTWIRT